MLRYYKEEIEKCAPPQRFCDAEWRLRAKKKSRKERVTSCRQAQTGSENAAPGSRTEWWCQTARYDACLRRYGVCYGTYDCWTLVSIEASGRIRDIPQRAGCCQLQVSIQVSTGARASSGKWCYERALYFSLWPEMGNSRCSRCHSERLQSLHCRFWRFQRPDLLVYKRQNSMRIAA